METQLTQVRPAHAAPRSEGDASDAGRADAPSEGGKRADGAAKGRHMQAIAGRWRSLQDTRRRTLTSGDCP
jgi:hypothetical protein